MHHERGEDARRPGRWRSGRVAIGAVAAVAAAAGLGACGSDDGGAGGGKLELTIGVLTPQTGASSAFGPTTEKSAQMAVGQLNDAAKKAGVDLSVQLASADNESDPVAAVAAARKLLTDEATCIVGSSSSATTLSVAKAVTIPQRVPMITPFSTAAGLTALHEQGGVTFRTIAADPIQAKVLADIIADRLGGATGKTISIAGRDDAFGQGLTSEIAKNWKALGGSVSGPLLYDPNASSYNGEAAKIVAGDPPATVIIDLPQTYAKVGAALLRTGKFDADKLFIAGGQPATIPPDIPPEAMNGAVGASPGFPTSGALVDAFNELWRESPGTEQQQPYAQNVFDAAVLCGLAAVRAKSTKPEAITEQVQAVSAAPGGAYDYRKLDAALKDAAAGTDVDYQGVSGPIDLNDDGDVSASFVNVYKYIDGKQTIQRQVKAQAG